MNLAQLRMSHQLVETRNPQVGDMRGNYLQMSLQLVQMEEELPLQMNLQLVQMEEELPLRMNLQLIQMEEELHLRMNLRPVHMEEEPHLRMNPWRKCLRGVDRTKRRSCLDDRG